jgi:hypothetical protein
VSTWFWEDVECGACGHVQRAKLAHGVHVARAPEVRDRLFDRTFHRVVCSGCGRAFVAERPLVYTDFDRKHWIQVALAIERPRWPELEVAAEALFERAFTGAPVAGELRDGFRRRLVFGLEELREKLVIWRASLDDAVVECLKAQVLARRPDLATGTMTVDDVASSGTVRLLANAEPLELDAALVAEMHADARLPDRFPELFRGVYVSLDRLLGPRYRRVAR